MKKISEQLPDDIKESKGTPYTGLYFRLLLAIVTAHIIVVYGETEPVLSMMLNRAYYIAMAASITIAFLLISYVHFVSGRLDRKMGWQHNQIQRGGYQLVLALIVPGIMAFFMAAFYFWLNGLNILKTTYLRYDFQFIMLWLFCLNIYYYAVYQHNGWQAARARLREQEEKAIVETGEQEEPYSAAPSARPVNGYAATETIAPAKEFFQVSTPLKVIPVRVEHICYFFRKNGHNFLHTVSGDVYAIPESLREIEERFVGEHFFRINRQLIVSFPSCISFRPGKNKTIEVTLYPPFNIRHRDEGTLEGGSAYVTVSEDRVHDFREWMDR